MLGGNTFKENSLGKEEPSPSIIFFYRGVFKIMGPLDSVYFSTYHQIFSPAARQKSHEMYGGMERRPRSPHIEK